MRLLGFGQTPSLLDTTRHRLPGVIKQPNALPRAWFLTARGCFRSERAYSKKLCNAAEGVGVGSFVRSTRPSQAARR